MNNTITIELLESEIKAVITEMMKRKTLSTSEKSRAILELIRLYHILCLDLEYSPEEGEFRLWRIYDLCDID